MPNVCKEKTTVKMSQFNNKLVLNNLNLIDQQT